MVGVECLKEGDLEDIKAVAERIMTDFIANPANVTNEELLSIRMLVQKLQNDEVIYDEGKKKNIVSDGSGSSFSETGFETDSQEKSSPTKSSDSDIPIPKRSKQT